MLIDKNRLLSVNNTEIVNGSFTIPNNVEIIDCNAFKGCKNLININIPPFIKKIENGAFSECINLKKVYISKGILYIGDECFSKCSNLESIIIDAEIEKLPNNIFNKCINLKEVKLSNSIKIFGDNVFFDCISLNNILLPSNLIYIGSYAFYNCISLTHITIPKKITMIGINTFSNCKSLKEFNILGVIEEIQSFAFSNCKTLTCFKFKKGIKKICDYAFANCTSLDNIMLPTTIKEIYEKAFDGCGGIKNITFPSSLTDAIDITSNIVIYNNNLNIHIYNQTYKYSDLIIINKIRVNEMLERIYDILTKNNHIYNLNKQIICNMYETNINFKNIIDSIIFNSRIGNLDFEQQLIKFDKLFTKTRFSKLPSSTIFNELNDKMLENYNVKLMNRIRDLDIFSLSNFECENLIVSIISFFGLFENDSKCYYRLDLLKKALSYKYQFNTIEYQNMPKNIKPFFIKVESKCFLLDDNIYIPSEFGNYLNRIMTSDDVKMIKKLRNRMGKIINDFFKNNYLPVDREIYILKENLSNDDINSINIYILNSLCNNQMTCRNLKEIFGDIRFNYDEDILNFFLKNISTIISKKIYRIKFKEIAERFNEIKNYYLSMGNDSFSFYEAYRYLCESVFLNVKKGNYEFEKMVRKAGVTRQSKFDKYQELYENIKDKKSSNIPRVKEVLNITVNNNTYLVLCEILRKDDPLCLLVGELSYTDCCQRIGDKGYACLLHAANNGRIICTYLIDDNKKILLSESWLWRNGNVLCFDNIEGTNYMKKDNLYLNLVVEAYKNISSKLVEVASKNNDRLDVIMIGKGQDNYPLLDETFGRATSNIIWPRGYYDYLDSSKVYYVYGNEKIADTNYECNKNYNDERIFINEDGINITTKTIQKLGMINPKYNNIDFINDLSNYLNVPVLDISIIYGEDWYILYNGSSNTLNILDSGMVSLNSKKELKLQKKEILKAYKILINKYYVLPDIDDLPKCKKKTIDIL